MSKVSYDPETGIFTWVETKRRGFVGKKAGCFLPAGWVHSYPNKRKTRTSTPVSMGYMQSR